MRQLRITERLAVVETPTVRVTYGNAGDLAP